MAEDNPYDLFIELGESDSMIEVTENWAFEYTYEDRVNDYGDKEKISK